VINVQYRKRCQPATPAALPHTPQAPKLPNEYPSS